MRMGIAPLFAVLLVLFVSVGGRSVVLLPGEARQDQDEIFSSLTPPHPYFLCETCLDVSRKVEKALSDPKFSQKIGFISTEICHVVPPNLQVKCLEILKNYTHEILAFLQANFREDNLCYSTGLCTRKSQKFGFPRMTKLADLDILVLQGITVKISDGRSCTECRSATDEILHLLDDPETKIKIMRLLLKACEEVEDHFKNCKRLVFEYAPLIFANLEKYLRNNDLCATLHLCEGAGGHAVQ